MFVVECVDVLLDFQYKRIDCHNIGIEMVWPGNDRNESKTAFGDKWFFKGFFIPQYEEMNELLDSHDEQTPCYKPFE